MLRKEQCGGIRDTTQSLIGHGEHAELVDCAVAVLERAYETEARMRIALEVKHRINHVLEHARSGERAFLGDVPDEDDRCTTAFCDARELRCAFANLCDRSWRRLQLS